MTTITMPEARRLYTAGNNAGSGYAPHPQEGTIEATVEAMVAMGWELVLDRGNSDEVAVLRGANGRLIAIGGDAMGRNAWAVAISPTVEA